jgi:LacI family transcriptional regulator
MGHPLVSDVLQGLMYWGRRHPEFELRFELHDLPENPSLRYQMDGIVFAGEANDEMRDCLRRAKCPVVLTREAECWPEFSLVTPDNVAVGRMAAEYFWQLGFRNFACSALYGRLFAKARTQGFGDALAEHGLSYGYHGLTPEGGIPTSMESLEWLRKLPKPAAVYCVTDANARAVCDLCAENGTNVPNEIAVLGTDNSLLDCLGGNPELSSIDLPWIDVGVRAVQLVADLMAGTVNGPRVVRIPPRKVIPRESTAVRTADPTLRRALAYIEKHACQPCRVTDVVGQLPVSHRQLDRLFNASFGHGIQQAIVEARINEAKYLLAKTQLTCAEISSRCGYSYPRNFTKSFTSLVGCTPSAFRKNRVRWGNL